MKINLKAPLALVFAAVIGCAFAPFADVAAVVESVSTSPFDPNPSQSYVFSATVSCVVDDGSVVLSVVGTDGYTDSAFCSPPSGDPYTCTLSVPGAEAGVFDKLTVSIAPDGVSKTLNIIF
mmetsp:Transcript_25877/g.71238  ORF Transcript_25877/g.71238 Transcript_25877/m.71238 type:complete len:121 (+) Transcript_25877:55-417(+)